MINDLLHLQILKKCILSVLHRDLHDQTPSSLPLSLTQHSKGQECGEHPFELEKMKDKNNSHSKDRDLDDQTPDDLSLSLKLH